MPIAQFDTCEYEHPTMVETPYDSRGVSTARNPLFKLLELTAARPEPGDSAGREEESRIRTLQDNLERLFQLIGNYEIETRKRMEPNVPQEPARYKAQHIDDLIRTYSEPKNLGQILKKSKCKSPTYNMVKSSIELGILGAIIGAGVVPTIPWVGALAGASVGIISGYLTERNDYDKLRVSE